MAPTNGGAPFILLLAKPFSFHRAFWPEAIYGRSGLQFSENQHSVLRTRPRVSQPPHSRRYSWKTFVSPPAFRCEVEQNHSHASPLNTVPRGQCLLNSYMALNPLSAATPTGNNHHCECFAPFFWSDLFNPYPTAVMTPDRPI
jgi:hypothetical protein